MTEEYLLNALFGLLVGFVGGYAGIGGAPILIFLLGTFLSYPQHQAQGTVLAIMLGPMTLPAMWVMKDRLRRLLRYIVVSFLAYAGFSYLGAFFAYEFSSRELHLLFAAVLGILGLLSFLSARLCSRRTNEYEDCQTRQVSLNVGTMALLGAAVGVVGGLFGIGAGVLMVPLLICWFRMDKDDARAISLAILLPPVSLGAVIKYSAMDDILWPMAGVGFAAYLASNYFGAKLGRAHRPDQFHWVMSILMVVLAFIYVVNRP